MRTFISFALSAMVGACVACGVGDDRVVTRDKVPPKEKTERTDGPRVDEELKLYVELFMADCEARRTDCEKKLNSIYEIRVVEMEDKNKNDKEIVIGVCYLNLFSNKVHINKLAFQYGHKYVQTIMYHELGHCMYDLDHEEKDDMLMSPMMPELKTILHDWSRLLDDFFAAIQEQNGP